MTDVELKRAARESAIREAIRRSRSRERDGVEVFGDVDAVTLRLARAVWG